MFWLINRADVVLYASEADKETFVKIFVFVAVFIFIAAIIGFSVGKKKNGELYGDSETGSILCKKAKIISKRTAPNPISPSIMVNWIAFELDSKERIELAIKDQSVFGVLFEGDAGMLKYQGKKFIEFKREV